MSLRIPRNWDFGAFRAETAKIARSKSVMPAEASPAAPHTSFRRAMDKPLKTGWLKKQRSIVKNWQLRYFVLRGNVLTYYKDERETAVQGTIPLFSCQVNELPSSSDDKFLFEITPGGGSDRERDVLMASSQSDLDDWVRSIRKIIGSRSGGVFGKSLAEVMMYEGKSGSGLVPVLVEKCADFIRERGLSEEGVFRLPGQDNQVKHFREAFDAGERPSFPSDTDVHTVASLLKLYLRELPEPVVPWSQYQDFLDSSLTLDVTTATGKDKLERQITLLPKVNYNLLSYICRFLFQVQQHSQVNKMSVENLATVMGVNLFKPQVEDAISMMKGTPLIQKVMTGMIRHHELLFPPLEEIPPPLSHLPSADSRSKEAGNPRNLVGWECAETQTSLQIAQPSQEQGTTAKEESWSPRKRTRTLPSISCPAGIIAREPSWERWSRIQENIDQSDEKTWSEDIFKLLDLQKVTLFSESEEEKRECEEEEEEDEEPAAAPTHTTDVRTSHSESVKTQPDALLTNDDTQLRTINRLQQENEELGAAVAELRAALEAERRSRAALEVLLSNAEKSRDEAVTESEKLSRRMEAFLSTSSSSGQSPYFH